MNRRKTITAAAIIASAVLLIIIAVLVIYKEDNAGKYINKDGGTVGERFLVPEGFRRVETEEGTFESFLRNLPLKKWGEKARLYNGKVNKAAPSNGVFDQEITPKNLQQCADACMRLWAEYLYEKREYDKIVFNFVNGFTCDYISWAEGKRVRVDGPICAWYDDSEKDYSYETFREYMNMVHTYANTTSLQLQSDAVLPGEIKIGDIFIMTASQMGTALGHAVIVVDMCVNPDTGEKLVLIAESTTPASETYVVKGKSAEYGSWIRLDENGKLETSDWVCPGEYIRRMK